MNRTVPFFLGMMKVGAAHVESLFFSVLQAYITDPVPSSEFPRESWLLERPCGTLVLLYYILF